MPGPQIKDWDKYHALRDKGMSKEKAARIANSGSGGGKVAAKVRPGDRKKTGMKGGKYPVATHEQRMSAIKLRHHGKGVSASAVLSHVANAARKAGDSAALKAVARARERDKGKSSK